jgi:hypothetical protein
MPVSKMIFAILSTCCGVMMSCSLKIARAGIISVSTMANPPKMAPATK